MKNMGSAIILAFILGLAGMAIGYWLFGKIGGEYVGLEVIFSTDTNYLKKAVRSIAGIEEIRSKILWCGAAGAALGFIFGLFPGRKR
jgi:hypothetical protein